MFTSLPIILIAFGLGFLLYNLGIISFTPWALLWPCLIIWLGLSQLISMVKRPKGNQDSLEIVIWLTVTTLGIYLLLPKIGFGVPGIPWKIIWPTLLIIIGILKLFPNSNRRRVFKVDLKGSVKHSYEYDKSTFIGDYTRGGSTSWALDDTNINHGVGSIRLDLTQAIVPDREVFINIFGYVGEANIYLPPDLPYKAECSLNVGEITVPEHGESGLGRYIKTQSADYDTAVRKVNIQVHWKIGEINIRQIR